MPGQAGRPPNVLFIWTDQQRPDTLGAYETTEHPHSGGGRRQGARELIRTPNLDRLAGGSTLFERAYCAQPVCSPSRASVLTGVHPHTHGVTENGVPLARTVPTLAELLRPAAYACGYVGKWHLGWERTAQRGFEDFWISTESYSGGYEAGSPEARGATSYHQFLVERGYAALDGKLGREAAARLPEAAGKPAFQAEQCVRFLETCRDRPFLLMCNFLEPHPPYTGPLDDLYDPNTMTLPDSWDGQLEPSAPRHYHDLRAETERVPKGRLGANDERDWKALKARYWGSCTLVDKYVGVILARLEALGLAEDTIVVYSTDHGDMMGEHHLLGKGVPYEGATRVPLIVRVPHLPASAGRRVETPVSQVSLIPTLLELTGQPAPAHTQGPSRGPLVPLVRDGGAAPADAEVVIEWRDWRAIRRGEWKLTVHATGVVELYDLVADPGETHNAAVDPENRGVLRDLDERLRAWQRRTGDTLALPRPAPAPVGQAV